VLLIDKFVLEGIDGISFGTNDLTMLILGIDRMMRRFRRSMMSEILRSCGYESRDPDL